LSPQPANRFRQGAGEGIGMNTIERARHRWREILPRLGIETRFLVNKHGPCPLCRGKDRFRFDDRDGGLRRKLRSGNGRPITFNRSLTLSP
jgi:putative DNA primase/helicase